MLGHTTLATIIDTIYPVGAYFITESSNFDSVAKVQAHFGGTWTRIENRFLYGSNSAGDTGGSSSVSVPLKNHIHLSSGTLKFGAGATTASNTGVFMIASSNNNRGGCTVNTTSGTPVNKNNTSQAVGTDSPTINLLPPYRKVYMYRRDS